MKRVLWAIIGVLVLLVLAGGLFVANRQRQSYKVTIPEQAVSAAKIHVDGLLADVLWNQLWHKVPAGAGEREQNQLFHTGMKIPANLFLYQIEGEPAVFFGTLPVADTAQLQTFIRQHPEWIYEPDSGVGRVRAAHVLALHDATNVAFALYWKIADEDRVEQQLNDLMQGNRQISLEESRFAALRNRSGHINVLGAQSLRLDFESGAIQFALQTESDNAVSGHIARPVEGQSGGMGWLQLPAAFWSSFSADTWHLGSHVLSRDSIASYIQGGTLLEVVGVTTQVDTVIRYEFDDDFNQVEVRDTVERVIPEIHGVVQADLTHLTGYLTRVGLLDSISTQVDPDAFPLFPIYLGDAGNGQLQVTTVLTPQGQVPAPESTTNSDDLLLYLDVAAIAEQAILPGSLGSYLTPFSTIAVRGVPKANQAWDINGTVTLTDADVNSLVQLIAQ